MKTKIHKLIDKAIVALVILFLLPMSVLAQKQGLAAIDSMRNLLKPNKIDSHQTKIIYRISTAYIFIDADSAMHYGQSGLKMAKKINWPKGIAGMYDNLGTLYNKNMDYKKAMFYYNEALQINQRSGNKRGETGNFINMATIYHAQGNDAKSLEFNLKALRIAQEIGEQYYTALLYGNIADIYKANKDYKKSLAYSLKAYRGYQKMEDSNGIAAALDRIGAVYYAQNELQKAAPYFNKSLTIYTEIGNKQRQAAVLSEIAQLHEENEDEKLAYLFKAHQLYIEVNPKSGEFITNTGNIGGTYAKIFIFKLKDKNKTQHFIPNDYSVIAKKAELYLTQAINVSKETGYLDNLGEFSSDLAQLQEHNGQYKAALQNLKISQNIKDSLYSQESKNQIATLEAQFAFQKKENQYKQQQALAKIKTQQIYLFAGLAIVIVSSILLYLLNRSNIRQLRLKNQLLRKEAEEQTKELLHQSKLLESELKAIRTQMNPHFIFNVLNSIESYIMDNDKRTASRLVQKFASLSRLILENSTKSLVTADKEWKALMLYTELEAMRYTNAFTYTFTVADDLQLKALYLPPMLIQPLIENAILHGLIIDPKSDAHLAVTIEKKEDGICITVEDNGLGMGKTTTKIASGSVKEISMGLSSIQERIDMLNKQQDGNRATFSIQSNVNQRGTTAVVCLPLFLTGSLSQLPVD